MATRKTTRKQSTKKTAAKASAARKSGSAATSKKSATSKKKAGKKSAESKSSIGIISTAAKVVREEPLGRRIEPQPVLRLGEPVTLIRKQQVLVFDSRVLQGRDDLF